MSERLRQRYLTNVAAVGREGVVGLYMLKQESPAAEFGRSVAASLSIPFGETCEATPYSCVRRKSVA